jgi:hypothetical protein
MTTATFPIARFGLLGTNPASLSGNPKKLNKAQRKARAIKRGENLSRPLIGMTEIKDILRYLELVESEFVAALVELAGLVTPRELKAATEKLASKSLVEKFSVIEEMAGVDKHAQIISVIHSMNTMSDWVNTLVERSHEIDQVVSRPEMMAHNEAASKYVCALLGLVAVSAMVGDENPGWPTDSLMHLIDAIDDLMDDAEVSLLGTQPANYDLKESQPLSEPPRVSWRLCLLSPC